MAKKAMVSSSHELASFWGTECLRSGGNVVDAAITTSAILSVVQNNMCGLGGDMFAIVKLNGRVVELNASGRAASRATIDFYEEKGFTNIPERGPLAALTVPGMVRGWGDLARRFATKELSELLEPAIEYAENGFPITEKYAGSIKESAPFIGEYEGWREIFLPDGKVPPAGFNLRQKDLASSLKAIASYGSEEFYEGKLSEQLAKGIQESGGVISCDDLKEHKSTWNENPIHTDYRGVRIYETSPNSQAATVLLWLNMLETFPLSEIGMSSAEFQEIMVDTCIRAYYARSKSIGDPEYFSLPSDFTSKKYAGDLLSNPVALDLFEGQSSTRSPGDTTYFAVGDLEGNCISVIQSNYMGFGSGLVPRGTGIVLHDRGCYFSLDRSHHNSLTPGKRTFHTLCASLAEADSGETLFAIGSMGGDVQPQIHIQLMTQVLDFGVDLQRAVDRPRWAIPMTIYEKPSRLILESKEYHGFEGLATVRLDGLSSLCGHAQAIYRTDEGLFGAADPRGDGASVGF